jgi:outer membrane protein assembly factor BamB
MDDELIYIPLSSHELVALGRNDGKVRWTRPLDVSRPPIVDQGVLFAVGPDRLHALDAGSGDVRWESALDRPVTTGPVVTPQLVVIALASNEVIALQRVDGQTAWRVALDGIDGTVSVATDASSVYVVAGDRIRALALADGTMRWQQQLAGRLTPAVAAGEQVFVGSTDNFFYALQSSSGRVVWHMRAGGDLVGGAVSGDLVFYTSLDNVVRAMNRGNGSQRWRKSTAMRPSMPPIVAGGQVVVPGVENTVETITGFDARTGNPAGAYTVLGRIQGRPLVDPVLVPFHVAAVVISRDGRVAGLRPDSMSYREPSPSPFQTLPGRALSRERLPE